MSSQKPLDASKSQIRVLKLASRMSTPFIKCHLTVVDLEDKLEYEALSYVWGSTTNDLKEIYVDGVAHVVTKTLYEALKALRRRNKIRILWVDALCIDQENHKERSHQVGLMGSIYAAATRVLVWLNKTVPGKYRLELAGTRAIEKLKKPGWLNATDKAEMTKLLCGREQWWYRAWTFQEAVLGPQLVFHTGRKSFFMHYELQKLRASWVPDNLNPDSTTAGTLEQMVHQLMNTRYRFHQDSERHLLNLVLANHHRNATDPRDLFYAYVGLAIDVPTDFIRYDLPLKAWVVYTTMRLIQHNQTLEVLRYVPAKVDKNRSKTLVDDKSLNGDLPSWCPDWTQALGPKDTWNPTWKQNFSSGQRRTKQLSFQPPELPESMNVSGVFCDKVSQVGDMSVSKHDLDDCWWYLVLENRSLHLVECSQCKNGIYGTRRSCTVCDNYNLCSGCYQEKDHKHADHEFLTIPKTPSELIHNTTDGPSDESSIRGSFEAMGLGEKRDYRRFGRFRLEEQLDAYQYPYPFRKPLQGVFQQVITGGKLRCDVRDAFRSVWDMDFVEDLDKVERKTLNPNFDRTFGKRPVISDKGYIGWGPEDTRVDDIITVLHGAGMPLILRRLDESKMEAGMEVTKCTLVGEAYISGLMNGEARDSVKEGTLHEQIFSIY